jgi:hypothetical protein
VPLSVVDVEALTTTVLQRIEARIQQQQQQVTVPIAQRVSDRLLAERISGEGRPNRTERRWQRQTPYDTPPPPYPKQRITQVDFDRTNTTILRQTATAFSLTTLDWHFHLDGPILVGRPNGGLIATASSVAVETDGLSASVAFFGQDRLDVFRAERDRPRQRDQGQDRTGERSGRDSSQNPSTSRNLSRLNLAQRIGDQAVVDDTSITEQSENSVYNDETGPEREHRLYNEAVASRAQLARLAEASLARREIERRSDESGRSSPF